MNVVDVILSRHTAYRITLSGLSIIAAITLIESFFGWLPYSPLDFILSLVILLFSTGVTNSLCALFTKATPTPESAYITALILFFILSPLQSAADALVFLLAGVVAILSKYIFVWGKVHIFNPAAVAALVVSVAGTGLVVWWVATPLLFPFVLVIGLLVLRKICRFDVFFIFAFISLGIFVLRSALVQTLSLATFIQFVITTPLLFFGLFMLIDPQTSPLIKNTRAWYGILVGGLASVTFSLGILTSSPELALLVGNVFAFMLGSKKRYSLTLRTVTQQTKEVFEFELLSTKRIPYKPGQHMEWTLPHKSPDNRGIRRFFALTSAPSEHAIKFCTTIPVESSSFKEALFSVRSTKAKNIPDKEVQMTATNLAGNFTLPKDPNSKILAIASGIGIAPYMSMFRELALQHERRDMVLLYSARTPLDFAFQDEIDLFSDAIGLRVIYLPLDFPELSDWEGDSGVITKERIIKEVRDFKGRYWFLAGSEDDVAMLQILSQDLAMPKEAVKVFHT